MKGTEGGTDRGVLAVLAESLGRVWGRVLINARDDSRAVAYFKWINPD